jgi:hypothetical protein
MGEKYSTSRRDYNLIQTCIWKDDNKIGDENKSVELILDQFG